MKLEKLLKKKYKDIENETKNKRAEIDFFADLIKTNYKKFDAVFSDSINELYEIAKRSMNGYAYENFFIEELYNKVSLLIKNLDKSLNSKKKFTYMVEIKEQTPDIKLGFTKYVKRKNSNIFLDKEITKRGYELINLYRKLSGKMSIERKHEIKNILNKF